MRINNLDSKKSGRILKAAIAANICCVAVIVISFFIDTITIFSTALTIFIFILDMVYILSTYKKMIDLEAVVHQKDEEIAEYMVKQETIDRFKSKFLSDVSYDIRTHMNTIMGFTSLATQNVENTDKVREYLSKIMVSGNELLGIINNISDMGSMENGRIHLDETEANLSDILRDINTIICGQVYSKKIDIVIDTNDVVQEDVYCDKARLIQILFNLISNIIRISNPGGRIRVKITQLKELIEEKTLFEFRIKYMERTVDNEPNDFGMDISRNIINLMGGTIEKKSDTDAGVEFILKLPFRVLAEDIYKKKTEHNNGMHILVIDDDFGTCEHITKLLTDLKMRPEWTMTGNEALVRAKQSEEKNDRFNAYIINLQLPETNVIELIKKLRSSSECSAPVIAMSSYELSDMELSKAKEAGVTSLCVKPLFVSELKNALIHIQEKSDNYVPFAENRCLFKNNRILLAEDNELNREIAVEILKGYGFFVETVENGEAAVSKIENSEPGYYDVVLMDLNMPVMDGCDATRRIRKLEDKQKADVIIIAMTAYAFDEDKQQAFDNGMDGYISKPIDIEKMIDILKSTLQNRNR